MEYLSLYKAHFINSIDEKNIYFDRFNASNTIHFPINIHNNESFLYLNNELLVLLEKIQFLNSEIIKKRYDTNTNLIKIWELYHSLVEEIVITNELECVVSTRNEVSDLLYVKKPKEYKRLYGLVNKYRNIFNQENNFKPLNDPLKLRKTYDDILLQDVEKEDPNNIPDGLIFRKDVVEVKSSTKTIHTGLYPESEVINTTKKALDLLNNKSIPALIRIACFHYFLGYIHPFYDGNGRISRYISSYYLSQILDPIASLRLSIACKKRQNDYYKAFKITNDIRNKGDITYFVLLFLDIYKDELENYLQDLTDKVDQSNYYKNKQSTLKLDPSSKKILTIITDYTLFHLQNIEINKIVELTDLSKSTVSNKIGILEKTGYIIRHREGKQTTFSFNLDSL